MEKYRRSGRAGGMPRALMLNAAEDFISDGPHFHDDDAMYITNRPGMGLRHGAAELTDQQLRTIDQVDESDRAADVAAFRHMFPALPREAEAKLVKQRDGLLGLGFRDAIRKQAVLLDDWNVLPRYVKKRLPVDRLVGNWLQLPVDDNYLGNREFLYRGLIRGMALAARRGTRLGKSPKDRAWARRQLERMERIYEDSMPNSRLRRRLWTRQGRRSHRVPEGELLSRQADPALLAAPRRTLRSGREW